ncbi:MAG: cytochrome c [Deltaproteobacteria bacterium]|nr:cytochrome c [Deltaproteobacteria bacterium]
MKRYVMYIAVLAAVLAALPAEGRAATAEENYQFYCAQCHGTGGRGDGPNAVESQPVSPRDHTSAVAMNKLTDEDIINAIEGGGAATSKSVLMPPFGKTLTKAEVVELKDYLRKLCKCKGK